MTSSIASCLRRHDGLGYEVVFWICVTFSLSWFVYTFDGVSVKLVITAKGEPITEIPGPSLDRQVRYNSSTGRENVTDVEEVYVEPELARDDVVRESKRRLAGIV